MYFKILFGIAIACAILLIMSKMRTSKEAKQDGNTKGLADLYKEMFLVESKLSIVAVLLIKLAIFIVVLLFMYAVRATNVAYYTDEVFNKFDYRTDISYLEELSEDKIPLALEQEVAALNYVLEFHPREEILTWNRLDIQYTIEDYLGTNGIKTVGKEDTFVHKVYNRAYDYHKYREYSHVQYIALALMCSFIVELILYVRVGNVISADRRNINYLKKILVVNSVLKPVNFNNVLDEMILEATPNVRKNLTRIKEAMQNNNSSTHAVLVEIGRKQKTSFERLFYEKLDQALNFDFDTAVDNVTKEIKYDRQELKRKYEKKTTSMKMWGSTIFMILLTLVIFYMLIPWQQLMNFNSLPY